MENLTAQIEASASPLYSMGRLKFGFSEGKNTYAVLGAMGKVMKGIEAIGKDRRNQQQDYKFRGIDDVYNFLHKLLADNDLVTVPVVLERKERETKSKNGAPQLSVTIRVEYWLTSCVDGSVMVIGPMFAEALDNSDKATNKAMSFAQKYALLQTFTIPTEDVAEGDRETIQREPGSDDDKDVQDITAEIAKKVYDGFGALGVSREMLEKKIGYPVQGLEIGWLETLRKWKSECEKGKGNIEKLFGKSGSAQRAEEMNKGEG